MMELETTLSELRGEIDRLDDELVDLLLRRARLVAEIGTLKGANGGPILRPGREAEILRRLLARVGEKMAGGHMEGAAVVRIWREIVSAAVRQQGPFSVGASVPANVPANVPGEAPSCWALARDQYGAATPIMSIAGPAQVVAAVADQRVTVGVLPYPASEEVEPWWPPLMVDDAPRVIAHLPAAEGLVPADGCARGLALALMAPEPSGEDRSLIALETETGIGRSRLRDALVEAGFVVRSTWFKESIGPDSHDGFLAEVDGFVLIDDPRLAAVQLEVSTGVTRLIVIGAFAVPPHVGENPGTDPGDGS
ncbi:MAG: chorismate mutase [Alphaproteobacteria bacterium]|nr:chorismate mutase [Alphaproteobacteria bacterium]